MKKSITLLALAATLLLTSNVYAETSGEALFEAKCASCHVKMRPSDVSTLSAPPIMGVMRHVKMTYVTKEEAVRFIAEYALNPQESKSVCMADKIKRFGLMPSQKGNVTKDELTLIGAWMYDNFGSRGQGRQNCKSGKCDKTGNGNGNGNCSGNGNGNSKACKGK
ncbi:MAG: c-type cytochrome [Sulfurovum sp.]|nr:c-type cytochrome [Sulfurovum sp.]